MTINIQYVNEKIDIIIDLAKLDNGESRRTNNIKICKWCNLDLPKGKEAYHSSCKKKYRAVIHRRKYAIKKCQKAIGDEIIYRHWA
jgi:hypothetical protein